MQKLYELGYIVHVTNIHINIGGLLGKHYTPGKPIQTAEFPHSQPNVDIRTAEFIEQTVYTTIIPEEHKIKYVSKQKTHKRKDKIYLFIDLFIKDMESIFGKNFVYVSGNHKSIFLYECGKQHRIFLNLIDKKTFKKGLHVGYKFIKPITKLF
jgi:hypothetical protein